jgi:EmrB/QacA subfamily drug resistance transporter
MPPRPPDPTTPAGPSSGRGLFLTVFPSVMLPMFMAMMDGTIVATALPAIAATLGAAERVSWVVIGYLIATTIAAPVYGRLGDFLGRRRLMFLALGVFTAASVFCAFAPSVEVLTAGRVLQGLGGGGLMTSSQALIGEAVPPRERARYQGYLAVNAVSASTFGPVAGGFLTEHLGWTSVFWVNVPLGLAAALLLLRLRPQPGSGVPARFDLIGLILFVAFIASALLAIEQAQRFDRAALPQILALVAVSIASLLLLGRQERRAAAPLLPIQLFRQPTIWRSDALVACHGATLVSLVTFIPLYLRVVRGVSASETGLMLLPLTAGIGVGAMVTGRAVSRTGRTAIFPSLGLIVVFLTLAFLAYAAPLLTNTELVILLAVNALFMGTVMSVAQVTVQTAAGPKMIGAAAGSVQFSRSVGAAFGTAAVGAVLFAVLTVRDPEAAQLFERLLEQGPSLLDSLAPARRAVVQEEIINAFRAAFLTIAGFAGAALALAWSIPLRRI